MAESKMQCNTESFQSINNLFIRSLSEAKESRSLPHSNFTSDIYLLFSLAKKMAQLIEKENLQSLHAIFCGINLDFFVIKAHLGEIIALLDARYDEVGSKIKSIEHAFYKNRKSFLAERNDKILVRGKRLVMDGLPELKDFEQTFDKDIALLIQHEIDHQNGLFLHETSIEVETF